MQHIRNNYQAIKVGFTLIELLIVVAIIAILAAIAVPNFLEAQVRAKASRAKADLRSVSTALESYYVDNNKYPRAVPFYPFFYAYTYCNYLRSEDLSNPANPHYYGSFELTTPIAYITSLPYDSFTENKIFPGNYTRFGYGYVNFQGMSQADFAQSQGYPNGPQFGPAAQCHLNFNDPAGIPTHWLLVGNGPDGFSNFVEIPASNWHGLHALIDQYTSIDLFTIYDPTNGSVSRGDIFRTQ